MSSCFDCWMCACVVLGLVFHTKPRDWLGERLRNDLFCVERDIKPQLSQSALCCVRQLYCDTSWQLYAHTHTHTHTHTHARTHTHVQFLKLSVGLGLGLDYFVLAFFCFCCVRFSFLQFSTQRLTGKNVFRMTCVVDLGIKPYFSGPVNLHDMRRLLISLKRKFAADHDSLKLY